ncbi:acyltransferase [Bacillus sp. E214]|uniref:acyltransferase n=1 Tax=Bacillus sp. E214 TaxID=2587156 RepID=UPI0011DF38D3|nr:acyltransferase [Bacillus sp. E214]
MGKLSKIILLILGIPKTIYFNFKYLSFKDAIKFPIILSSRVLLYKTSGKVTINAPIKPGMIRLGFGGVRIFDRRHSRSVWYLQGNITFKGKANLGYGTRLSVFGDLTFGDNFAISAQTQIVCNHKITFGDGVIIGWDCLFMDSDAHWILNESNQRTNKPKEIIIGDRVWIGARCTVNKGTKIANDVVIATSSVVYGTHETPNSILGGNPVRIIKEGITWEI